MPRAKPKPVQWITCPTVPPQKWPPEQLQQLLSDLDLSVKTNASTCMKMLDALAPILENYRSWMALKIPSHAERRAELVDAKAALQHAFDRLCSLSWMAQCELRNAGVELRKEQEDGPERLVYTDVEAAIKCAQNDLAVLIKYSQNAIDNLPKELRGRRQSVLPVLIEQITPVFDRFYNGDKEDHIRGAARENFVRNVLTFANIPPPQDLIRLLPKQ